MNKLVIAIDGPAASGKSTVTKEIAKELNIDYVDTGAMYRAFTLKLINQGIAIDDIDEIIESLKSTNISFKDNSIYLDGINVDRDIRQNVINNNVSDVAKLKEVRDCMVYLQQEMSKTKSIIMDGRDIATVVLPNANYKFFVTASIEERARRRYKELVEKNDEEITYEQIRDEIKKRDEIDSTRNIAPLKKSPDSYIIDTTNMTIKETIEKILSIIREEN